MAVNHAPGEGCTFPTPDQSGDEDLFGSREISDSIKVEESPSSSRSATPKTVRRGAPTSLSVLDDSDLFEGVDVRSCCADLSCSSRTPASGKRISDVPGGKSTLAKLFPTLGASPNVHWTSAFLTPVSGDRSKAESSLASVPESKSPFVKRFLSPCQVTPVRSSQSRVGVPATSAHVFRWESSGYRPATFRRPAFPEDLSPLKLEEKMEDIGKAACAENNAESSTRLVSPVLSAGSGKENLAPPEAGVSRDWGEFDIGGSQEEAIAEHMEQFEQALNAGGEREGSSEASPNDGTDVGTKELETSVEAPRLAGRSISSHLKAFFEGDDDPDLEAGLLSAACEAEQKEFQKYQADNDQPVDVIDAEATATSSQIPMLPVKFTGGFKTLAGQALGVDSAEARERARKLWATCETDEPPVDSNPSVPSVPATMTKSEVKSSSVLASPTRPVCGFRTLAGVPLTCSQATLKEYSRFYESELALADEDGPNRPPSPEIPLGKGEATRLTRSSLAKPPTPSAPTTSSPVRRQSAPPPFLTENPKLAKAAKLFEDIDGFDELLSQDFAPKVTPVLPKGDTTPSVSCAKRTPGLTSAPAGSASIPTPPQPGSKKKPLFESFAAECKDLNFGLMKNLGGKQGSTSKGTPVGRPSSSRLPGITPANSRSILQNGSECSSTPRGLFRSALRVSKTVSQTKPILQNEKTYSQESTGSDRDDEPKFVGHAKTASPVLDHHAVTDKAQSVADGPAVKRGLSNGSDIVKYMDVDFEASDEFLQELQQLEEQNAQGSVVVSPLNKGKTGSGTKRKLENGQEPGPAKKSRESSETSSPTCDRLASASVEVVPCDTAQLTRNSEASTHSSVENVMPTDVTLTPVKEDEAKPLFKLEKNNAELIEAKASFADESTLDGSGDSALDLSLINRPMSPVVSTRRSLPLQRSPVISRKVRPSQAAMEVERVISTSAEPTGSENDGATESDGAPVAASPVVQRRRSKRSLGRKRKSVVKR